ncbi:PREDICTED: jacalin-related lectin 14-like [Camelina sativa]|uniref:Jacalin-related lectin 14-like n=1 Tax=Camelina sativa TaxID=90675 RepID=A0ABM0SYT0_CAMSA|nr:PREDICTED: jacalin-related lectin 14-like [Camelina sativa]
MAQRLEVIGSTNGFIFDDGFDHDDVAMIFARVGLHGIDYLDFTYVKSGELKFGVPVGSGQGLHETFHINNDNNEHLKTVEVYYDCKSGYIKGLQFKTNFRISELIGYEKGDKFTLAVEGKNINGFHGYLRNGYIVSLGAYFTLNHHPNKLEGECSKRGNQWDDGADHEGIAKIHVRGGFEGIQYIKFDYVKRGKPKDGAIHGLLGSGFTQTFKINYLYDEHLLYVDGYYDVASGVIQSLQFKTNFRTSEVMGYEKGKKFSLGEKGEKITGFHGYADKNLNSLEAYVTTILTLRTNCHGGTGGISWDDDGFESLRKVYVSFNKNNIKSITFHYHNHNDTVVGCQHGWESIQEEEEEEEEEFELDYPNELITCVEGTFKRFGPSEMRITSLIFKSSQGRTSPTFGIVSGTKFVLEYRGCAVVGFYGCHDDRDLVAIGAYFYMMPPPTAEKLRPQSGCRGESWDDGVYDNVRKIYVGQCENGIAFLKFVYDKDTRMVIGDDHGNKTPLDIKEFDVEYPSEYITAVDGCYDKVIGSEVGVITMLRFKTNKRTSISVGFKSSSSFLLYKVGYKIVGFHGKASDMINHLGVHVVPLTE